MSSFLKFTLALFLVAFFLPTTVVSQEKPPRTTELKWEDVRIPAKDKKFFGDAVDIELQATLYRPVGEGPYPAIIFNHGSTGFGAIPAGQTLRYEQLASFFLERGMVFVAPMRRGRGQSGGAYDEAYRCDSWSGEAGMNRAKEDLDAVLAYVRKLPFVDQSRIVLSGGSRGGILSSAYAAERPGAVRAVVNFVGGWLSEECSLRAGNFNEYVFRSAGGGFKVPNLWLYAENDSYYDASSIRRFASSFQGAGGTLTFRLYGPVGRNGHSLGRFQEIWGNDTDTFLGSLNVVTIPKK